MIKDWQDPQAYIRDAVNLRYANDPLGSEVATVAVGMGLRVTRYSRHYGRSFDGWMIYAVYDAAYRRPQNLRSKRVLTYTRARYSKWGFPSIVGEKRALSELLTKLQEV